MEAKHPQKDAPVLRSLREPAGEPREKTLTETPEQTAVRLLAPRKGSQTDITDEITKHEAEQIPGHFNPISTTGAPNNKPARKPDPSATIRRDIRTLIGTANRLSNENITFSKNLAKLIQTIQLYFINTPTYTEVLEVFDNVAEEYDMPIFTLNEMQREVEAQLYALYGEQDTLDEAADNAAQVLAENEDKGSAVGNV